MSWLKSFWKSLNTPVPQEGNAAPRREHPQYYDAMNNFTPRAQKVLSLAREEANRFHHNFVGTEHVLLGLIKLGQGTAVKVLEKMGVSLETARLEVEKQVGTGPDQRVFGNIPYTPRVKHVLGLAAKEAKALNHTYVGTEHLLLGLLQEGEGAAALVLKNLGIHTEETRQEILRELDPKYPSVPCGLPGQWTRANASQRFESEGSYREKVDLSKRYDVYCREGKQQVAYRNVLFKGIKTLFQKGQYEVFSEYIEIEQADGKTVLIARSSVIKFCEHGTTPGSETVPDRNG